MEPFIQEYVDDLGWDGYWVTFMFRNISGSKERKIEQMHREICRVYQKLATRAVRKPRSEKWVHLLPKGIFFLMYQATEKATSRLEKCQSTTEFMCMGSC
jgi:hypothetical protein